MTRLPLAGFVVLNDSDRILLLAELNNVLAKYAGAGNYSLAYVDPSLSVVESEAGVGA